MGTMQTVQDQRAKTVNAAVFRDFSDAEFIRAALSRLGLSRKVIAVSNRTALLHHLAADLSLPFNSVALDRATTEPAEVFEALLGKIDEIKGPVRLIMDTTWALGVVEGGDGLEAWSALASDLAAARDVQVVSLYDQARVIEDQMAVAFRAHKQFLAPSGLRENPYWLPQDLQKRGTLEEQYSFLLGRVMPDYNATPERAPRGRRLAARGAAPDWLGAARQVEAASAGEGRWHIHCLGQLRVYKDGHQRVNWKLPGGSSKKTRTLFAYLLNSGEKGAHAERIAELLWPEGASESQKRARLHHVVAMLRKTLGGKETVVLSGDYYRLNIPSGSWIDISSFEQFCRRGMSFQKMGQYEDALLAYRAAERLYAGDLFEDLPLIYTEHEDEDWCSIKRTWLSEVATKLQTSMALILRESGRLRLALEHAQKALEREPDNEAANVELMRIFHAQGRSDALSRHYRQYVKTLGAMGVDDDDEIRQIYADLMDSI